MMMLPRPVWFFALALPPSLQLLQQQRSSSPQEQSGLRHASLDGREVRETGGRSEKSFFALIGQKKRREK